jgi:PTH1 family peptidyl-tRNA hydrolase
MKLVVGLGNPGSDYEKTRHNIGFNFLDFYLEKKFGNIKWTSKFDGLIYEARINNQKVIFLKPQTFMNLSGNSVRKVVDFFNINIDDIIVVSDDLDLNIGNFKLRASGSSGGHNGLKDIESKIGSSSYKRLKIGISKVNNVDTKDYVLGNFNSSENKILSDIFNELVNVMDDYFDLEFSNLMNKYNRKNR